MNDPTTNQQVREARYRLRLANTKMAQMGTTIHRLRCELAEAREINGKIERGELRYYERTVPEMLDKIAAQAEEITRLREKLAAQQGEAPS
jgi:hypothetical protein